MVDPITDDERSAFYRKVKLALVALVGVSAGLVTLQTDATLVQSAAAVAGGLLVGGALVWIVLPSDPFPLTAREADGSRADGGRVADDPFGDDDDDSGRR